MSSNTSSPYSGTITTQNVGAPNGNAVTASSTVTARLDGAYDTAAIQVTGTYTGALTVQVTIDDINWITLSAATSLVNVATAATAANIASATQGIFQLDISGFTAVRVTALAAMTGSAIVSIIGSTGGGVVGIDTPVVLAAGGSAIGTVATAAGSAHSLLAAASTNATSVKATAGNVFETTITNFSAATKYIKFYDKASAPTVGTDSPVAVIEVPANASLTRVFGTTGKRFASGIALAITGAQAIADTTAVAAGDIRIHTTYV